MNKDVKHFLYTTMVTAAVYLTLVNLFKDIFDTPRDNVGVQIAKALIFAVVVVIVNKFIDRKFINNSHKDK